MFEKKESLLVLFVILIGYSVCSWFVFNSNAFIDEQNILSPIRYSLAGLPWPVREYPDFPYLFYKYIYLFFKMFFRDLDLFSFSRTINSLFLPLNTFLFYVVAKKYIKGLYLIIACFFFTFSPGVFFSSTALKTESLTLCEFLLTVFFTQRFLMKKQIKWAFLCGITAALGVTTKYYVMFPLVFFSGQFMLIGSNLAFFDKIKKIVKDKYSHFFILGFLISFFITWPSVWNVLETSSQLRIKNDTYFTDGPTISKAVDEWFAFPYGRYSYPLVYGLPMNLGILIYFTAIFGILSKKISREAIFLLGGPTLLYLILVLNFTLLRPLYQFTICAPFFILCSSLFLQENFKKALNILNYFIIVLSITCISLEHDNLAKYYRKYAYILGDVLSKFSMDLARFEHIPNGNQLLLLLIQIVDYEGVKPEFLEKFIERERPQLIFIHKALFDNFCKYRSMEKYLKICNYSSKLLNGEKGYKIYWTMDLKISINFLGLDPEYSSGFYLLRKE
jgi:Dolichyl-phosphate-mannose-protein mannosyltransferase